MATGWALPAGWAQGQLFSTHSRTTLPGALQVAITSFSNVRDERGGSEPEDLPAASQWHGGGAEPRNRI